jgi:oligopeptide/dipeptide ABC transporter ATP-binding protein
MTANPEAPTTRATRPAPGEPLLTVDHVSKIFPVHSGGWRRGGASVHAVDDVSLEIRAGETLGLVGETGCGKSTLARCIARLYEVSDGTITIDGRDVTHLKRGELRAVRREAQMIFQDPYGSLNPRRRVGSIIGDPFVIHKMGSGREIKKRVQELMERVGLNPEHYNRFPAEFSGGQRQRIGVARALALQPRLVICDEPVSALDVSIQAQVLNLLIDLQDEFGLTYLFISHDLSVIRHVSDRIAVMYLGKVVEIAETEDLFSTARHPYTKALLSALPIPDPDVADSRSQTILVGDLPSPTNPPSGCRFHTRCPRAQADCAASVPPFEPVLGDPPGHRTACFHPLAAGEELVSDAAALPDLAAHPGAVDTRSADAPTTPGGDET